VNVGYQTLWDLECRLCHWVRAEVGTGVALQIGRDDHNVAYVLFNMEAGLAKNFDPDFRLSPGVMVGSIIQLFPPWRVHLSTSLYYPVVGGRSFYYRNFLRQHVVITRDLGLRLELNQFRATIEGLAALQIYF
jgi:hypothetical protein